MRRIHAALIAALLPLAAPAGWRTAGSVDAVTTVGDTSALLRAGESTLAITVCAEGVIRVRFSPHGAPAPDPSWAVLPHDWPKGTPRFTDTPAEFRVTTPRMSLVVQKAPCRLAFLDAAGSVIASDDTALGMCWNGNEVCAYRTMPAGEQYYGFGEKGGDIRKRNTAMSMWNSDIPAYGAETDPLYESIPFLLGVRDGKAYGIFFDNPSRTWFDMGKQSRRRYAFGAESGDIDYYFFCGPSAKEILSRFTALVGRMPLPPRWSLGYQQCRWSYAPESRVREIARNFRSRHIPCDMIYLDIDYMDGYRIFTWNRKAFPDPKNMIADLGRMGFTVAVIVDPGIKTDSSYAVYRSGLERGAFVRAAGGGVWTGTVWPGMCAFPDFTATKTRQWWGAQFAGLVADGVRGFWNDMNEPSVFDTQTKTIDLDAVHPGDDSPRPHAAVHNVYGMEMVRATYEGVKTLLKGERPFVLTRASYAGGERYSAAWTGDNISSWEHLAMTIPMCLNMGLSGQPFTGADIGGFIGHPSGELFARWLELGVFTPLMRAHSVIGEVNKEPWEYGDAFTDLNRETINLRYRFLPYIYTAMEEASATGIPAMRAMLLEFPDDPRFVETADQFM
ncbi:MAG TPA: TIM-barrel domain-containing protein, partial [Bacteroidota bacterium]|nr:TIM-barrel domain-containing protein [Bacteroidota bacterium]